MEITPYTAISISILARIIFMYLLYKNNSKNTYSLIFCILNISSSTIWIVYSINQNDLALVVRSGTEIFLLVLSVIYIIRNKVEYKIVPLNETNNTNIV